MANLQKGDRVMLTHDETWALTKGTTGVVIDYQLFGGWQVKFENGEERVVDERYLARI